MKDKSNIKQIKDIPMNKIKFCLGLMLCLLSIILVIDAGYVARTFNFIFYFLFGFGLYFIYLIMFLSGIYLMFFKNKKIVRYKIFLISGTIIAYLSILTLLSLSLTSGAEILKFENYDNLFLKDFLTKFYANAHIPLSAQILSIGGGSIGYLFAAIFNLSNNEIFGYVISSLLILLGIIIIFLPYIVKLIKKQIKKSKQKQEQIKQEFAKHVEENGVTFTDISLSKGNKIRDHSSETIKNAAFLTRDEKPKENSKIEETHNVLKEENFDRSDLLFNNQNYEERGGLTPARYQRVAFSNAKNDTNYVENMIKNEPAEDVVEQKMEQMTLDLEIKEEEVNKPQQTNFGSNSNINHETHINNSSNNNNQLLNNNENISQVLPQNNSNNIDTTPSTPKQRTIIYQEEEVKKDEDIQIISFQRQKFIPPAIDLLKDYENNKASQTNNEAALRDLENINNIFQTFNIGAHAIDYVIGPSVTQFAIVYDQGVSFKSVNSIINDLSIRLGGVNARFEPIVYGKPYSGLEIPNQVMSTVGFKEVMEKLPSSEEHPLAVAFGKNIQGEIVYADLCDFPHMLVAGTTGSGKSIFIHSVIMTLIMRNNPSDLRIVLVDPKQVEMTLYRNMPHLLCPIIVEPEQAVVCLNKLVDEMENRYRAFSQSQVTNIKEYNKLMKKENKETMPYILAILDEYSDLVDRAKDIARPVISLAQKSRACGIHLIISTQRPSTNVINGVIKGNLPTHVALMTASSVDSITIIGEGGAEKLLGKGDMLVQSPLVSRTGCVRLQSCFVQNEEINSVVKFLKSTLKTEYDMNYLDLVDHSKDVNVNIPNLNLSDDNKNVDSKYEDVKKAAMAEEYFSISKIQRIFGFGFTRAGRIFNQLQQDGIIASSKDSKGSAKGCKVLIHDDSYGINVDNDSNEVSSVETLNEYIDNANNSEGSY